MEVKNLVGFGDIGDIFMKKKFKYSDNSSAIKINTVRKFLPGQYVLSSVWGNRVKIVHHEMVSPMKIHDYLYESNTGCDWQVRSHLNPSNWMHVKNWGDYMEHTRHLDRLLPFRERIKEHEKNFKDKCFFVNADIDVQEQFFVAGETIKRTADNKILGYMFNIVKEGEFDFGSVFEDKETKRYFALVVEGKYSRYTYTNNDLIDTDCQEQGYKVNFDAFRPRRC